MSLRQTPAIQYLLGNVEKATASEWYVYRVQVDLLVVVAGNPGSSLTPLATPDFQPQDWDGISLRTSRHESTRLQDDLCRTVSRYSKCKWMWKARHGFGGSGNWSMTLDLSLLINC